jgi:hypothetical protein
LLNGLVKSVFYASHGSKRYTESIWWRMRKVKGSLLPPIGTYVSMDKKEEWKDGSSFKKLLYR